MASRWDDFFGADSAGDGEVALMARGAREPYPDARFVGRHGGAVGV